MFKFNIFTISSASIRLYTDDVKKLPATIRNFFSFYLKLHERKLFLCSELFFFKDIHTHFPSNFPDPKKIREKEKKEDFRNVDLLDKA